MQKFKVGDRVKLVSGGPDMTVICQADQELYRPDDVVCCWFVAGGEARERVFPEAALVAAPASPPSRN